MRFLARHWLGLLVAVGAVAGAYVWIQVRGRRRAAVRFTNLALLRSVAPKRPGWQRHIGAALLALSLIGMVVALARPAREVRVARRRAMVMMAIDVSVSMQATDVSPTRLAAAKRAATEFAESLPATVRLGLVSFAGQASVLVPPTSDRDAVTRAVRALHLGEGTAIGEAVLASLRAIDAARFGDEGAKAPASVVLMSDGTTTVGTPNDEAAATARRAGIPVTTIAFGTDAATITYEGETVPVPVDRTALADLADTTRGRTFSAATATELIDAYRDIGTSVGFRTERREATTAVLGASLVVALLAAAASLRWTARLP